ncbi:deleted in malignant brain tumors 1 protein-like, partial [Ruditapes philippinarum]|uniref:deleted in malignant brain tumors 1 protein-like n=1 Tax=Ruditapes philippinarum TaxID=129788 RepID=UPI00295BDCB0
MAMWTHIFVYILLSSCFLQCSATSVRLVGGSYSWEGTVQIYHNGWGTICDDDFAHNEARVICRMLGYSTRGAISYQSAHFGQGSGQILLDDLSCDGSENDIANCGNRGWGTHNCGHHEDAGVRCGYYCRNSPCRNGGTCNEVSNSNTCSCRPGFGGSFCEYDISHRIIGGTGNFEGVLDLNYNSNWGTFCRNSFSDNDATVVCKMRGFSTGVVVDGSRYGQLDYGTIWTGNMGCSGTESHVRFCSKITQAFEHNTACSHNNSVGVICSNHTSVRLVGNILPSEGRVEVHHNGVWGTVCGAHFTQNDANVVCHMLGFSKNALSFHRNVTGGQGPVWLNTLGCSGSEADIEYCSHGSWDNHTCSHTNDVSVKCEATKVRLFGGSGDWDGTLEINYEGSWRTVCDPYFGQNEARVVCNMLGYNLTDVKHYVYQSNYFGDTKTGFLDQVKCVGNEKDITQCVSSYQTTCSASNAVGLKCDGIQVRLADGPHKGIGRIEVLHNGQWGTVCDTNWDDNDAVVICKMLSSYPFESNVTGKAVSGSFFGRGNGRVWLSDVQCTGSEVDISNCSMSWSSGVNCDHSNDAGVICDYPYQKRLADGRSKSQGRVEFLESGTWYSYCTDGWNKTDAKVICKEIGYWNTDPVVSYNSTYGNGRTTYIVKPKCDGSEGSFEMCRMDKLFKSTTCSVSNSVGVECKPISA